MGEKTEKVRSCFNCLKSAYVCRVASRAQTVMGDEVGFLKIERFINNKKEVMEDFERALALVMAKHCRFYEEN